jgi:hypothetical protein
MNDCDIGDLLQGAADRHGLVIFAGGASDAL